jgi:hypothetical protein
MKIIIKAALDFVGVVIYVGVLTRELPVERWLRGDGSLDRWNVTG